MKLVKVETKGFKSFADKVTLSFDGGVVGVVGPNGSGKSNINDAIKWVLGEQSIKSLRGDSSDDVIFAGSKLVQASNKAEVSLTFDNSEKRLSLPHQFVTITRVVERGEGGNAYYINGEVARLKDIKEIAMESGIGKSSLAIISQGTISDIAEATPENRRLIFEEAAGVSKYKSRKKEALRKLDATSEALDKVKTVVHELERQLNPLKRQAEKAKIYLAKKDELKDVEIGLIVEDLKFFGQKLSSLNSELEDVISSKEEIETRVNGLENNINEKTSYKLKLENEVFKLTSQFQEISDRLRDVEVRSSRESEKRRMIIEGQVTTTDASRLAAMEDELKELSKQVHKYKTWEEKSIADIQEKRLKVAEAQKEYATHNYEMDSLKNKLLKLRTKHAMLVDHRDNKSNLFKGVKTIVENKQVFNGYNGLVSELIEVPNEYRAAIEAILSGASQHIVVDNSETAVKAVNFLKENRAGRATFIPLQTIQPKGVIDQHDMVARTQNGYIGVASDLVNVSSVKHEILKRFLLGNIIVTDTVENATKLSKVLNSKYMVVSLDGDIVRRGGVLSGGEKAKSQDMFGTDEQISKIEDAIPLVEEAIKKLSANTQGLANTISEEQAIIGELNIETAKVREKRHVAENQFSMMKTTFEAQSQKKFEAHDETAIIDDTQALEAQKSSIQALLKAKRESTMSLNSDLAQYTMTKTELEKTLRSIIEASSDKMTQKAQAEFIINSSKKRLSEEYEMTLEMASQNFKLKINQDEARDIVAALRSEIKELGHVNIESIEAFEEVNARFTKLKASEEELFSAQQTIISAINEMDQIIISRLDKTIKDVNGEFNNVFKTMFGGGFAEIRYTNPSNLLETGVDVIAQPPGKTVKNLKLFSGGEKALIAISLLFAILKSKPLPLCILDEVEAALDDANVVRFANYLQKLKEQTQFLVITHRVGTMSRVDHLFGATMQNRGVTSFFTVKLEDAKKLIEE